MILNILLFSFLFGIIKWCLSKVVISGANRPLSLSDATASAVAREESLESRPQQAMRNSYYLNVKTPKFNYYQYHSASKLLGLNSQN